MTDRVGRNPRAKEHDIAEIQPRGFRHSNRDKPTQRHAKRWNAHGEACARSTLRLIRLTRVCATLRGFPHRDISRVLRALASIQHITLEARDAVLVAVDAFDNGLHLADAPHPARSARASGFATFDQRLAKRAKGLELTNAAGGLLV